MAIKKEKEFDNDIRNQDVIDIALPDIEKQQFRINGDNTKIIELNPSDMNIITRLNEVYGKLQGLEKDFKELASINIKDENDDEGFAELSDKIKSVDQKMREYVDYLFDYPVSDVCAGNGSMYDPINGKLRYEHIIEVLAGLYENNINSEIKKVQSRMKKHTGKYTK